MLWSKKKKIVNAREKEREQSFVESFIKISFGTLFYPFIFAVIVGMLILYHLMKFMAVIFTYAAYINYI